MKRAFLIILSILGLVIWGVCYNSEDWRPVQVMCTRTLDQIVNSKDVSVTKVKISESEYKGTGDGMIAHCEYKVHVTETLYTNWGAYSRFFAPSNFKIIDSTVESSESGTCRIKGSEFFVAMRSDAKHQNIKNCTTTAILDLSSEAEIRAKIPKK